jgi:hypothetical protein
VVLLVQRGFRKLKRGQKMGASENRGRISENGGFQKIRGDFRKLGRLPARDTPVNNHHIREKTMICICQYLQFKILFQSPGVLWNPMNISPK